MGPRGLTRRRLLELTGVAAGGLAGCNALDSGTKPEATGRTTPNSDHSGGAVEESGRVESILTEWINYEHQIVGDNVVGGDGSATDPFVVDNSIWDGGGHYHFPAAKERNHYETTGLKTPTDIDWNETNVCITGSGVRLTQLSLADGANDNVINVNIPPNESGNFGKIAKMAVYGNRANNTAGNGIQWSGRVIDPILDQIIVRYCTDTAIRGAGSVSGLRLSNFWAENSEKGVYLNGGSRQKVWCGHVIGNDDNGFTTEGDRGNYSSLTIYDNGNFGLVLAGANRNLFTNVLVTDNENDDIYIGENCTDNVISGRGFTWSTVRDQGTRTVLNGWGTNTGDPNATGEWHGCAEYAGSLGATIWDTTTSPWTPYTSTPNGEWVAQ